MEKNDRKIVVLHDRYRLLIEAVTDYAIYMLDPSGIVTTWNPGAQRIKGYAPEEIIGQHFSRFYSDEDRAAGIPETALRTAAAVGKFEAEGWRIRKDGTRFWAFVIIDPILHNGELVGFAKVTRDLTDRWTAEQALKKSEEQFRLLIQGVTDYAIYMLDSTGHVTNWNAGAERIKGYKPFEIVGKHFSNFYTNEDRLKGEPQAALTTATRAGRFEKEAWRVRKDGSTFWAHVIIDPIRNDVGEIIGFAKITRDITERREAQLRLEKTREALLQSQKMEAIGQLTGGVAHDFNNLLMAVLGSLELVRKRLSDDPKAMTLVDNAIQGAQRGATLTKRMLAFARRQDLKEEAVDVRELFSGMSDLLERSLGPNIVISTRFVPNLPAVKADANQLEMALLNLAVNARDAMPDGGQIVVAAKEELLDHDQADGVKAGRYVRVGLSDTGTGMDADTLARATEPFFTTKGTGKGTGLGLSMVHGLAQQFGGHLTLQSKLGQGTVAELWLPVAGQGVEASEQQSGGVEHGESSPLIILAVDDDMIILMNTVAMLEDLGHTVHQALSGREALAVLENHQPDLIITDHAMPGMTGAELADIVRRKLPDIPIILATGYAELPSELGQHLPRLPKPFSQVELAESVTLIAKSFRSVLKFPAKH